MNVGCQRGIRRSTRGLFGYDVSAMNHLVEQAGCWIVHVSDGNIFHVGNRNYHKDYNPGCHLTTCFLFVQNLVDTGLWPVDRLKIPKGTPFI